MTMHDKAKKMATISLRNICPSALGKWYCFDIPQVEYPGNQLPQYKGIALYCHNETADFHTPF